MNRHNWNNLSESTQKALREQGQAGGGFPSHGGNLPSITRRDGQLDRRQPRTRSLEGGQEIDPTRAGGNKPGDGFYLEPKLWGEAPDCAPNHPCGNMTGNGWEFQGCDNGVCRYTKTVCNDQGCVALEWLCTPAGCRPQTEGWHNIPGEWVDPIDEGDGVVLEQLLQEAYEQGYRQSLNEQSDPCADGGCSTRQGFFMLCALVGVCNYEQYLAWIKGCPACAEFWNNFWKQWHEDGTVINKPSWRDLPNHGGDFEDLDDPYSTQSEMPANTNDIQIGGNNNNQNNNNQHRYPASGYGTFNGTSMREAYKAGYYRALNEQDRGNFK